MILVLLQALSTKQTTTTSTPTSTAPETPKQSTSVIANPLNNKSLFNALSVKIHALRSQYLALMQLSKWFSCYSKSCTPMKALDCYSPLCKKRSRLRVELLDLLHKANALNQANKENKLISLTSTPKKITKSEG